MQLASHFSFYLQFEVWFCELRHSATGANAFRSGIIEANVMDGI